MAVLQMQKISICALKKDRKAVLEKLQRMKVMEISQILEEDPDFTTIMIPVTAPKLKPP